MVVAAVVEQVPLELLEAQALVLVGKVEWGWLTLFLVHRLTIRAAVAVVITAKQRVRKT
jgi:hypothetical protein